MNRLLAALWSWAASLWGPSPSFGPTIDPNGNGANGDIGPTVDPNG